MKMSDLTAMIRLPSKIARNSLKESIRVTEIVWDNGGWNIPLPPSTVCVPKKDVVFEGETLDDLMTIREEEFRARVNDYLSERFGADVVGWRYKGLFVSNSD